MLTVDPSTERTPVVSQPRYPEVRVTPLSRNPLVWVSEVRQALRRSGVPRTEIQQFTETAFSSGRGDAMRRVCNAWAEIDLSEVV